MGRPLGRVNVVIVFELWGWGTPFSLRRGLRGTVHIIVVVVSMLHDISVAKNGNVSGGLSTWNTLRRTTLSIYLERLYVRKEWGMSC